MQSIIAAKFGGTSVGDAARILHIRDKIVSEDPQRKAIVVSAPAGVTNALIKWANGSDAEARHVVQATFRNIIDDLGQKSLAKELDKTFDKIEQTFENLQRHGDVVAATDYLKSRGEWLNAQIVANVLGYECIDPMRFIVIDKAGRCKWETTRRLAKQLKIAEKARKGIVVAGFYGRSAVKTNMPKTFSRGGSDITGSILAVLVNAEIYENWTDVDGIYAANPSVVKRPKKIERMTFKELRELTFMGFKVFHEDAVAFARNADIPIHVRNTSRPDEPGTLITREPPDSGPIVTGIAGKNGFSIVTIERFGLNDQLGIQSKVEHAFIERGISVNTTSSIDSITVIVETAAFEPLAAVVLDKLKKLSPDDIRIQRDIALICTVGERMRHKIGMSAAVSSALAEKGINIILELQGGSEINIMRGVLQADAEKAMRALYEKLFMQ